MLWNNLSRKCSLYLHESRKYLSSLFTADFAEKNHSTKCAVNQPIQANKIASECARFEPLPTAFCRTSIFAKTKLSWWQTRILLESFIGSKVRFHRSCLDISAAKNISAGNWFVFAVLLLFWFLELVKCSRESYLLESLEKSCSFVS